MYLFDVLLLLRGQQCSIFIDTGKKEKILLAPIYRLSDDSMSLIKSLSREILDRKVSRIEATSYNYVSIYVNDFKESIEAYSDLIGG